MRLCAAVQVERECRDYEAAVVKALVVFCKSKGIDVDEENLQKQMAAIRQQQIKAQAATAPEVRPHERRRKTRQPKSPPSTRCLSEFLRNSGCFQNTNKALTVRYGFQAVAP